MEIKNVKWSSGGNIAPFKLRKFVYSCSCRTLKRKQKFLSFHFENDKKCFLNLACVLFPLEKGFAATPTDEDVDGVEVKGPLVFGFALI